MRAKLVRCEKDLTGVEIVNVLVTVVQTLLSTARVEWALSLLTFTVPSAVCSLLCVRFAHHDACRMTGAARCAF